MMFLKGEKVFSLFKTVAAPPYGDITALFQEFYCYLLIAGFFREGEGVEGVHFSIPNISEKTFALPSGSYQTGIAQAISKGLQDRYLNLSRHPDLNETEYKILVSLDGIFTPDKGWFAHLTGKDLLSVAFSRGFDDDMQAIAQYVAKTFGQYDYPEPASVPRLYMSAFGNIHLAKPDVQQVEGPTDDRIVLGAPLLRYGSVMEDGTDVTALWSFLSAQTLTLSQADYPGNQLCEVLSNFVFLGETNGSETSVPLPRFAAALYIKSLMGLKTSNPIARSALFYNDFLYGSLDTIKTSRYALLQVILDLMMKHMGETNLSHLFSSESYAQRLSFATTVYTKKPQTPPLLKFALEALDTLDDDAMSSEEAPQATEDDYDPANPPPAVPTNSSETDENTIGLISFDRSGEGVDENLYREAVVALNDRLQSDDSVPIDANTKDALNEWVNGYLWRTAISATKEQITFLNLQKYLKIVSTKG